AESGGQKARSFFAQVRGMTRISPRVSGCTHGWYLSYQPMVRRVPKVGTASTTAWYKTYQEMVQTWYTYLIDCKRYERLLIFLYRKLSPQCSKRVQRQCFHFILTRIDVHRSKERDALFQTGNDII